MVGLGSGMAAPLQCTLAWGRGAQLAQSLQMMFEATPLLHD